MAYITLPELAELAGISERAAEKAVARSRREAGYRWRDVVLVSRTVCGRGGRSGLCYQVRVDSLPAELQRRFNELYGEPAPQLFDGLKGYEEREFRRHIPKDRSSVARPSGGRLRRSGGALGASPSMYPSGRFSAG